MRSLRFFIRAEKKGGRYDDEIACHDHDGRIHRYDAGYCSTAQAQDAPPFIRETFPEQAVDSAWKEFQAIMGPGTELDPKVKELIGLAVAAQVPCDYCVYYHTAAAKQHGASEKEIKEALASSALVRKWSTMLNGSQYDEAAWKT